jgi:outer membrane protein assembly factor BamD (BamD/ComL family)
VIGGVAVAALLLLGVVLGSSGNDRDDRREPSFPVTQPAVWSTPVSSDRDRDKHEEKRWRKIQDKLRDGDLGAAESELRKLLDRNPDDPEARELLERIQLERRQRGQED